MGAPIQIFQADHQRVVSPAPLLAIEQQAQVVLGRRDGSDLGFKHYVACVVAQGAVWFGGQQGDGQFGLLDIGANEVVVIIDLYRVGGCANQR